MNRKIIVRPAFASRLWPTSNPIAPVLLAALLALAMAVPQAAGQSDGSDWARKEYGHFARDEPLQTLLRDFVTSTGTPATISPKIKGRVSGSFHTKPAAEFLAQIAGNYNLAWVHDGTSLYIYVIDEIETRTFDLPYYLMDDFKQRLEDMELKGSPISWKVAPARNQIEAAGPLRFIELVEGTIASLQRQDQETGAAAPEYTVRVFPVRYGFVDATGVGGGGKQGQGLGMAEMLGQLMNVAHLSLPALQSRAATPKLRGTGLVPVAEIDDTDSKQAAPAISHKRGEAFITSSPRLNAIIVRDLVSRMDTYEKLIQTLDVPLAQIQIEVAILDINDSDIDTLGLDWLYSESRDDVQVDLNAPELATASGINLAMDVATARQIVVSISGLKEQGKSRVVSRPTILTLDNHEALFENNLTFYVRLGTERASSVDLVPVSFGSRLIVRPHVIYETDHRKIYLGVHVEDGTRSDGAAVTDVPEVARTLIQTQAVIGENQSLLIGGYNIRERILASRRLPFLGRIPLLKRLFTWKREEVKQFDRYFVITPTILDAETTYELDTGFEDLDREREQMLQPYDGRPRSIPPKEQEPASDATDDSEAG